MNSLAEHFRRALTCTPKQRKIGLEVESLVVQKDGRPITVGESQGIMHVLVACGWKIVEEKTTTGEIMPERLIVRIECEGFAIIYELGWNNFELMTPVFAVSEAHTLLAQTRQHLEAFAAAVTSLGLEVLYKPYDGHGDMNTLMLPDERDQIWIALDGDVLTVLGHIASVHLNIDICSVEEGMAFARGFLELCEKRSWPAPESAPLWARYLAESLAGYDHDRYGPPPLMFEAYCKRLAQMPVVMHRTDARLLIPDPQRPFSEMENVDLDLFHRSVWWRARFRVRNGRLVMELRDIPRRTDDQMENDVSTVLVHLGLAA